MGAVLKISVLSRNLPQDEGFSAPNLHFLAENFPTRIKFFDRLKLGGEGGNSPMPPPLPRRHCRLPICCRLLRPVTYRVVYCIGAACYIGVQLDQSTSATQLAFISNVALSLGKLHRWWRNRFGVLIVRGRG